LIDHKKSFSDLVSGVNFINILEAAFTRAYPKSAKKYSQAVSLFALLGSACIKAARKSMVKLTPGEPQFGQSQPDLHQHSVWRWKDDCFQPRCPFWKTLGNTLAKLWRKLFSDPAFQTRLECVKSRPDSVLIYSQIRKYFINSFL
jgi:hypothetical protein